MQRLPTPRRPGPALRRAATAVAIASVLALTGAPALAHPGHVGHPPVDPEAFRADAAVEPEPQSDRSDLIAVSVLVMLMLTAVCMAGLKEVGRRQAKLGAAGARTALPDPLASDRS